MLEDKRSAQFFAKVLRAMAALGLTTVLLAVMLFFIGLSGTNQVYAPDLVARKVKPGMSYKQCAEILHLAPPSINPEGLVFVHVSRSGFGSLFGPQHETRLLFDDGVLRNIFVKWVHHTQEFEYSIWPELEDAGWPD